MDTPRNPFIGYGTVVHGERFVGRDHALDMLRQHLPIHAPGSSISIVGLPKVGKSSLLEHGLMQEEARLLTDHVLPLWVNVALHPTGVELFQAFVSRSASRLARLVENPASLEAAARQALVPTPVWSELMDNVQEFFIEARRQSWSSVIVLDEFDEARHLYSGASIGASSVFQGVRELANNPRAKVVFAIVTRRPVADIEQEAGGGSTLSEVLDKYRMPLFSAEETGSLLKRLAPVGVEVSDQLRERANEMCGGHPYLSSCFCYFVAERARLGRLLDLDEVCGSRDLGTTFAEHYRKLDEFLRDVGLFEKLLEVIFGPQISVTQDDVLALEAYGLIGTGKNEEYVAFSRHYQNYLRLKSRTVDLWPVWGETERGVRAVLLTQFTSRYGDDWPSALSNAHQGAAKVLEGCRRRRAAEQRSENGDASTSLLDFTEPADLWPLLKCEWPLFAPTFKRDQGYWGPRFDEILPVRRALAHNRPIASASDRMRAEAACRDILACLNRAPTPVPA